MNVELLTKVRDAILAEPLRINMDNWTFSPTAQKEMNQQPKCGTVGCVAGWTIAIRFNLFDANGEDTLNSYAGSIEPDAREELGIDEISANKLFYPSLWPEKFRQALQIERPDGDYDPSDTWRLPSFDDGQKWHINLRAGTPEYARIVADRIDHFIATNGAE